MAAGLIQKTDVRGLQVSATMPSLLISALCLLSPVLNAEELSDPTQPPAGIYEALSGQGSASTTKISSPTNNGLQSIIISPERRAAIINGKTVELGGKVGSAKLIEVSENGVVLQDTRSRRTLALFPGVNLKISKSAHEAVEHDVPEEKK